MGHHLLGLDNDSDRLDPDRHALDADPDPDPAKWCGSDPIPSIHHNNRNSEYNCQGKSNFIFYNPWYEVCLIRSCENIGNSLQPFLYVFLLLYFIYRRNGLNRRKVRLIEGNVNCRHLKNLPVKGLCGRCLYVWGPLPSWVFVWGVVKQFRGLRIWSGT